MPRVLVHCIRMYLNHHHDSVVLFRSGSSQGKRFIPLSRHTQNTNNFVCSLQVPLAEVRFYLHSRSPNTNRLLG